MLRTKKTAVISVILAAAVLILGISAALLLRSPEKEPQQPFTESAAISDNMATGKTVIDKNTTYQTITGFGVSSEQWAKTVGGLSIRNKVMTLLYSDTEGIGLDIYRYHLGAGTEGQSSFINEKNRTQGFMADADSYDFSKDTNSRACLQEAKSIAGDRLSVVLTASSPPTAITKNKDACSSLPAEDNAPYESNLAEENYEAYADYLYAVAEHFVSEGYNVTGVSPVYQPQYGWRAETDTEGNISAPREGCHFSPTELRHLLTVLTEKFDGSELHKKGVRLSAFECGVAEGPESESSQYFDVLFSEKDEYKKDNKDIRNYFDTVSLHSYWTSAENKLQTAMMISEISPKLSIACTEYCQVTNDGNNGVLEYIVREGGETRGLTIEYGLAMANIIMTDLCTLNATEWSWWLGCSSDNLPNGLIYIDTEDPYNIITSKRLWCLGNFSKYIEKGALRVAASSGNEELPMTAFINPDGSLVAIYLNMTEKYITTDVSDYMANGKTAYVTSADRNLGRLTDEENTSVTIPAQSLVTVIFN